MKLKNIIWLSFLVFFLGNGCQLFFPRNVETIVKEKNLSYWRLSPNGDYIVYGDPRGDFLLNLATGKENKFDCNLFWWDHKRFSCYKHPQLFVSDVETLTKTPLLEIDLSKEPSINNKPIVIETLLAEAELIYRPEWVTDTVYILAPNYQLNPEKNYIVTGLENPDELLAKYNIITFYRKHQGNRHSEKTFSPNALYYYDTIPDGFAIFNADNNKVVVEFTEDKATLLDIGGWAIDSSGVYFRTHRFGLGGSSTPKGIRKLTIPDE